MFIKRFITLLLLLLLTCFTAGRVSAHELSTDHAIGAVLHTDPDDDPLAGSQTALIFEIKDTTTKFVPANCECLLVITRGGKHLSTQPLFQNPVVSAPYTATIAYTFPVKDVYHVQIIGKPLVLNTFQPFTLNWDIRVARSAAPAQASPSWFRLHLPHIIGVGIILSFFMLLIVSDIRTRRRGKKE